MFVIFLLGMHDNDLKSGEKVFCRLVPIITGGVIFFRINGMQ